MSEGGGTRLLSGWQHLRELGCLAASSNLTLRYLRREYPISADRSLGGAKNSSSAGDSVESLTHSQVLSCNITTGAGFNRPRRHRGRALHQPVTWGRRPARMWTASRVRAAQCLRPGDGATLVKSDFAQRVAQGRRRIATTLGEQHGFLSSFSLPLSSAFWARATDVHNPGTARNTSCPCSRALSGLPPRCSSHECFHSSLAHKEFVVGCPILLR